MDQIWDSLQSSRQDNLDNIEEITEPVFTCCMEYVFVITTGVYKCNRLQESDTFQMKGVLENRYPMKSLLTG